MTPPTLLTAVGLAESWLASRLRGDPTLMAMLGGRIYAGAAPEPAVYPLLVFAGLSGTDSGGPGATRLLTRTTYGLSVYGEDESIVALDPIAARADLLVQRSTATMAAGWVLSADRQTQLVMSELVGARQLRRILSTYSIIVKEGGQ